MPVMLFATELVCEILRLWLMWTHSWPTPPHWDHSHSLVPATESQYETWHHNRRMTKTISANSLNFTNLYLLSYYFSTRINWKNLHTNTSMNGLHWSCIFHFFVLTDKLKKTCGYVHLGKQSINRYVDDLIVCIKLRKMGEKQSPKNIY